MKRGELWTASGGKHYAGKPRPVLILQADLFDRTASITVCPLTTDPSELPLLRIPVQASHVSGVRFESNLMVDKVTTMPRSKLEKRLGTVSDDVMRDLSRALIVFLGIA